MKNIYLFMAFVAIVSLATASCNKNNCENCTITTEPCTGYAPEGVEVSWTDYNTVESVGKYFKYKHTADMHRQDTIRVCGYILGFDDTNYYRSAYTSPQIPGEIMVYITDNPDKQFQGSGDGIALPLVGNPEQMDWLLEYKAKQKVYLTAFCCATDPAGSACAWIVEIHAISCHVENT